MLTSDGQTDNFSCRGNAFHWRPISYLAVNVGPPILWLYFFAIPWHYLFVCFCVCVFVCLIWDSDMVVLHAYMGKQTMFVVDVKPFIGDQLVIWQSMEVPKFHGFMFLGSLGSLYIVTLEPWGSHYILFWFLEWEKVFFTCRFFRYWFFHVLFLNSCYLGIITNLKRLYSVQRVLA